MMKDFGLSQDGLNSNILTGVAVLTEVDTSAGSVSVVPLEHGGAPRRRIKELIGLLVGQSPDWEQPGARARTPAAASALAGALMLAGAVEDPKLSAALREAALRHLTPDGA